jgi:hypothetical protein
VQARPVGMLAARIMTCKLVLMPCQLPAGSPILCSWNTRRAWSMRRDSMRSRQTATSATACRSTVRKSGSKQCQCCAALCWLPWAVSWSRTIGRVPMSAHPWQLLSLMYHPDPHAPYTGTALLVHGAYGDSETWPAATMDKTPHPAAGLNSRPRPPLPLTPPPPPACALKPGARVTGTPLFCAASTSMLSYPEAHWAMSLRS